MLVCMIALQRASACACLRLSHVAGLSCCVSTSILFFSQACDCAQQSKYCSTSRVSWHRLATSTVALLPSASLAPARRESGVSGHGFYQCYHAKCRTVGHSVAGTWTEQHAAPVTWAARMTMMPKISVLSVAFVTVWLSQYMCCVGCFEPRGQNSTYRFQQRFKSVYQGVTSARGVRNIQIERHPVRSY